MRQRELTDKGENTDGPLFDRNLYFDRPTEELIHGKAVFKLLPDELTPPDAVINLATKNNTFANTEPPKVVPKPLRRGPLISGPVDSNHVRPEKYYKEITGRDDYPSALNSPTLFPRIIRWFRGFGWGNQ